MLIEMHDGQWLNLQNVKSVLVSRAKVLETGETKWHVVVTTGQYHEASNTDLFDTREEAKAFAEKIVDQLNGK